MSPAYDGGSSIAPRVPTEMMKLLPGSSSWPRWPARIALFTPFAMPLSCESTRVTSECRTTSALATPMMTRASVTRTRSAEISLTRNGASETKRTI